jgi:hypothetical protein
VSGGPTTRFLQRLRGSAFIAFIAGSSFDQRAVRRAHTRKLDFTIKLRELLAGLPDPAVQRSGRVAVRRHADDLEHGRQAKLDLIESLLG